MIVKWGFEDDGLVGGLQAGTFAQVYQPNVLFVGEILELQESGRVIVADKQDASLIEILNWAEEELKFRASHGEKI